MTAQTPIVNAGLKYINGLNLSLTSDEVVAVASGACRDSSNVNDIVVSSDLAVSNIISGAGGLDTGTVAINTFYAVFVVADSTKYNDPVGLLSLSATDPTLPGGYDMFRRIGWVKTDGTSDFLEFRQQGASNDRWMWYDIAIATDITAGASATFAAVDVSGGIPDLTVSGELNMLSVFTPTAGNDTLELRPGSSSAAAGYARASGAVAAVAETTNLVCPFDVTTGVDYIVTGSAVALSVAAYMDKLI
jgi:hypothetical protein